MRQVIRNAAVEGERYVEDCGAEVRNTLMGIFMIVSRQRESIAAAMKAAKQAYRKTDAEALPHKPPVIRIAEPEG
jgi:hypothetical protein